MTVRITGHNRTPIHDSQSGSLVTTTVPTMTESVRITGHNHSAIHDRVSQDHWSQPQCLPWQSFRITGHNHSAIHDSHSGSLVTTTMPSMTVSQDHWSQPHCHPWQSLRITALRITGHNHHAFHYRGTQDHWSQSHPWQSVRINGHNHRAIHDRGTLDHYHAKNKRISAVGEVLHTDSYQTKSREKTLVLDRKQQMNLLACNVGCSRYSRVMLCAMVGLSVPGAVNSVNTQSR